jgi:hypothetical protein
MKTATTSGAIESLISGVGGLQCSEKFGPVFRVLAGESLAKQFEALQLVIGCFCNVGHAIYKAGVVAS